MVTGIRAQLLPWLALAINGSALQPRVPKPLEAVISSMTLKLALAHSDTEYIFEAPQYRISLLR